MTHIYGYQ